MPHTDSPGQSKRIKLILPVRFISCYDEETTGTLIDISEGGFSMQTNTKTKIGDPVIAYPEGLGRVTGKVIRIFDDGIAVQIDMTQSQRHHLQKRIEAVVSGIPYMRMLENRKYKDDGMNLGSEGVECSSGKIFYCHVIDISKSGSKIRSSYAPDIGAKVQVGSLQGVVRRHTEDGFAISFTKATRLDVQRVKSHQGSL